MDLINDILETYKPSGLNTHRISDNNFERGFVEWLEEKFVSPFYLFQRLDAGTSGILLIAKTKEAAAQWSERLKLKKVIKKYLFLSKPSQIGKFKINQKFKISSHISKQGGSWVSELNTSTPNAETEFTLLNSFQDFQLWSAEPITGKTHQIRLQAESLGVSVLGDSLYGGAPFFRLCLHALEIQVIDLNLNWKAEAPPFFIDLNLLSNPKLCSLIGAIDLRKQLINKGYLNTESFRLSHNENRDLRIDSFGDQLWFYNYSSKDSMDLIQDFFRHYDVKPSWVREMKNRGEKPNESLLLPLHNPLEKWIITENQIKYELRSDQGLSPGLFLDQRENRKWVQAKSLNKKVLNLFSYTCGFSLNAAIGKAKEVVSVDASSAFLEWGKRNFQLNDIDPLKYEFWTADCFEFLKRTLKIKRKFDLIICDPPSFGRTKRGIFNIEKDLSYLIELIFDLLEPKGLVLISTNYEKWNDEEFSELVYRMVSKARIDEVRQPHPPLDFIDSKKPILKTIIFQKK